MQQYERLTRDRRRNSVRQFIRGRGLGWRQSGRDGRRRRKVRVRRERNWWRRFGRQWWQRWRGHRRKRQRGHGHRWWRSRWCGNRRRGRWRCGWGQQRRWRCGWHQQRRQRWQHRRQRYGWQSHGRNSRNRGSRRLQSRRRHWHGWDLWVRMPWRNPMAGGHLPVQIGERLRTQLQMCPRSSISPIPLQSGPGGGVPQPRPSASMPQGRRLRFRQDMCFERHQPVLPRHQLYVCTRLLSILLPR